MSSTLWWDCEQYLMVGLWAVPYGGIVSRPYGGIVSSTLWWDCEQYLMVGL